MMKKALAILALAGLLAGCGDTSDLGPGSEPDPASPPAEPTDDAETEAPEDLEVEDDDAEVEGQLRHEFDNPVVYESNGVRLSITGIGFTDVNSEVVDEELRAFLEDDTETIMVMEMTVSNDSGEEINVFANQGTVQIGRKQVDASLLLSDSFAGTMRDGVDDDGLVVWELDVPFDEAVAEGSAVYTASAPSSEEDFQPIADDIELTVEWLAP